MLSMLIKTAFGHILAIIRPDKHVSANIGARLGVDNGNRASGARLEGDIWRGPSPALAGIVYCHCVSVLTQAPVPSAVHSIQMLKT